MNTIRWTATLGAVVVAAAPVIASAGDFSPVEVCEHEALVASMSMRGRQLGVPLKDMLKAAYPESDDQAEMYMSHVMGETALLAYDERKRMTAAGADKAVKEFSETWRTRCYRRLNMSPP